MKKFGFTLVEVLVTLSIVGVIAALTIPSLAMNAQKKYWANALANNITNFEMATKNLLMEKNAVDMYDTEIFNLNTPLKDFPKYLKNLEAYVEGAFNQDYGNKFYDINKDLYVDNWLRQGYYQGFSLKNGGMVFIYRIKFSDWNPGYGYTEEQAIEKGLNYRVEMADIYIDVNGKKLPNIVGRDIFQFSLDENGKLHAYGSREKALYSDNEDFYWKTTCFDSIEGSASASCTGRLVENNFVMDY